MQLAGAQQAATLFMSSPAEPALVLCCQYIGCSCTDWFIALWPPCWVGRLMTRFYVLTGLVELGGLALVGCVYVCIHVMYSVIRSSGGVL